MSAVSDPSLRAAPRVHGAADDEYVGSITPQTLAT